MYLSTKRMFFLGNSRIQMKHAVALMGGSESYRRIIHECKQHLIDQPSYSTEIHTEEGILKIIIQRDVRCEVHGRKIR